MTEIKSNNYSIFVSKDIYKEISRFLKTRKYRQLFILVDENTLRHCYPQLVEKIKAFESAEIIEIESGEESKNIEVCVQIWTTLSEFGANRKALFVNLGGGVIGDVGGFIASTFKRGIDFINIPTTLLSQVDASVGGKVGIDLNHLKNEIGVFNNPLAVFVNSDFLKTLDKRQLLSGYAEIIKHALINDVSYWKKVTETNFSKLDTFDELIEISITIKNKIVMADPKEQNIRKSLNFGHTIGHAIETFSLEQNDRKHLLHGEAIAVGMICEAYLSNKMCSLSDGELLEIVQFIINRFQNISLKDMDMHRLLELMKHDKKNDTDEINFSLLASIGKCEINKTAKPDLIKESLKYYIQQVKLVK